MTESTSSSRGGVGVCNLLGVAFIVLRLCDVIDWSWWWVLAPLWGPLAILLAILAVAGIIWTIGYVVSR